nr:hypothetical protein [Tanacetum cinerariifolium]
MSKTYPSWEESRLEQEGEEQHCILTPPCSCQISDSLKGCLDFVGLEFYSSFNQSFSQALIPLVVPEIRIYYLEISAIFSAVASLYHSRGNFSSLAVGTSSGSGNSSLAVGMP